MLLLNPEYKGRVMMSRSIKVTIIEDHDMTRMGLSFALSNNESIDESIH